MKENITKSQLFEYFTGNTSFFLKNEIENWLKIAENQEQYFIWLEEYERKNIHWKVDTNLEFEKLQNRISFGENIEPEYQIKKHAFYLQKSFKYAASVAGLLLLCAFLLKNQLLYKTYTTAYGVKESVKLEDGTNVMINANSSLTVPRFGFGNSTREVKLDGEAFFSVSHTPTHQKFIVKTDKDFSIEVLGTEFDVRKRGEQMQVVLEKGKVKVHYGQANEQIMMKPGDKVTLNEKGKAEIEKTIQPKAYSAWRNNKFVFAKTTLKEVANILKDNFGLNVILPADLAHRSLSGEIEAKNADELIEALSAVFELKITKQKNKITIE